MSQGEDTRSLGRTLLNPLDPEAQQRAFESLCLLAQDDELDSSEKTRIASLLLGLVRGGYTPLRPGWRDKIIEIGRSGMGISELLVDFWPARPSDPQTNRRVISVLIEIGEPALPELRSFYDNVSRDSRIKSVIDKIMESSSNNSV